MDDIVTIMAFLVRKQHHHLTLASQATTSEERFIQEDEAKRYASAAARLRELMDDNEVLRSECKAWRRSLVIELSRFPKIRDARAATDARTALEPKQ